MDPAPRPARRVWLGLAFAAAALALLALAAWRAAEAALARAVDETVARFEADLRAARERAASARSVALRGETLDEDAVPRYDALAAKGRGLGLPDVPPDPFGAVDDQLAALAQQDADLEDLRAASRCARAAWPLAFDRDDGLVPYWDLQDLTQLLVVQGHVRAQAGDAAGAAERYLDAARVQADLERGRQGWLRAAPLEALARLIASEHAAALPLDRLEGELDRLEACLPTAQERLELTRLLVLGTLVRGVRGADAASALGIAPRGLADVLPRRLVNAHALLTLEGVYRSAGQALATGELEAWDRLMDAARAPGGPKPSWSSLAWPLYPDPAQLAHDEGTFAAWLAFARLAIALERQPVPRDARRLAPRRDPFQPGAWLRVEVAPDGVGYRLWTPGLVRIRGGAPVRCELELVRR